MRRSRSSGFTVVEVAVVVPIVSIIILGVFAIILVLLQSSAAERVGAQNLYDIHAALDAVEDDAALSASFLPTTDAALADANAPSGGWSYMGSGDTSRVLILRSYATTTNPRSADRRPAYQTDLGCGDESLYSNKVVTYDTIFFVSPDGTLYRRRLVDTNTPTCFPVYQVQSCPASAGCAANDEVIATGVTNFTVAYYVNSAETTKSDVYTGSTGSQDVSASGSAAVTIGLTRRAYGQPLSSELTLRISKLITRGIDD